MLGLQSMYHNQQRQTLRETEQEKASEPVIWRQYSQTNTSIGLMKTQYLIFNVIQKRTLLHVTKYSWYNQSLHRQVSEFVFCVNKDYDTHAWYGTVFPVEDKHFVFSDLKCYCVFDYRKIYLLRFQRFQRIEHSVTLKYMKTHYLFNIYLHQIINVHFPNDTC